MSWVTEKATVCTKDGRDIMYPGPEEKPHPGRPRLPDGDGNEEKRARDRARKAAKKVNAG